MSPNPQETTDLVAFTEEILYGNPLNFCAVQESLLRSQVKTVHP